MNRLHALLRFLRLTDVDGSLSLTSVTLLVVLAKVVAAPLISMTDLGLLLAAIAQYQGKKVIRTKSSDSALSADVKALTKRVDTLTSEFEGNDGLKARLTRTESRAAELARVPRR